MILEQDSDDECFARNPLEVSKIRYHGGLHGTACEIEIQCLFVDVLFSREKSGRSERRTCEELEEIF